MPGLSAGPRSLLPYLGAAARDARRRHGCKQIEIALRIGCSEHSITNFERGYHWPRNPDLTVQGYADELGLDPFDIWREALARWEDERHS